MSWWVWATIGLLAYSGAVALVVRACRWSARVSHDGGAEPPAPAAPAIGPLTPAAAPGPDPTG